MMEWVPKNIRLLHDFWTGLAGGQVPERAQFGIENVRGLLPYLMLSDFDFSPFRVRFRLSGTAVDEMTGVNLTGRYLDEFATGAYATSVTEMIGYYEEASQTGRPRIWSYPWVGSNPKLPVIWAGLFPLKKDGRICQCISIEDYTEFDGRRDEVRREQATADWARLSKRS